MKVISSLFLFAPCLSALVISCCEYFLISVKLNVSSVFLLFYPKKILRIIKIPDTFHMGFYNVLTGAKENKGRSWGVVAEPFAHVPCQRACGGVEIISFRGDIG